jgi:hypothetical protein
MTRRQVAVPILRLNIVGAPSESSAARILRLKRGAGVLIEILRPLRVNRQRELSMI